MQSALGVRRFISFFFCFHALRGSILACAAHFFQHLFKQNCKQNGGKRNRNKIGYRFRRVNSSRFVGRKNLRHNVDERDQQHKFAHHRNGDGGFGVAERGKCHLARHLNTEKQHARHIDAQRFFRECKQFRLACKHGGKSLRKQHYGCPKQRGVTHAGDQKQLKCGLNTLCIAGAVVVADDGLRTLAKPLQRQHGELHNAC